MVAGKGEGRRNPYGSSHQRSRARWARLVALGDVACARCGRPIEPGSKWHLDHDDHDRSVYIGASHSYCNVRAAGRLAGRGRPKGRSTGALAARREEPVANPSRWRRRSSQWFSPDGRPASRPWSDDWVSHNEAERRGLLHD
jgi:hypothetical protein